MASTVSVIERTKLAGRFFVIADITMDNSYPTNGLAVSPRQLGLNAIDFLLPANAGGYSFEYDHANKKLKAFVPVGVIADAGVSGADNTIMKSAAGTLEVAGTGTAFQQAAVEAANATNLAAVTVRVMAVGI